MLRQPQRQLDGLALGLAQDLGVQVLRAGEDVEPEEVERRSQPSSREQRRDALGVDAELLGTAAHPHARALDLEVGVDAHGDPRSDAEPLADVRTTRSASVSDSISIVTPAATAWASSAGVLPGPAKLTRSGGIGVSSATRISPAEATSNESTSPLRCWTTAGIGFALTA